jgi:putative transposase
MGSLKALDELTLADLLRELPRDRLWEDIEEQQRNLLKLVLEGALEEEMVELLAASRYRRVENRRGHRNGFYDRDLVTQIGIVRGMRVPRARGLSPERVVLGRYQRRCVKVDHLIRNVFLRGVSTRQVGEVLQELLGEPVSAATVSRVAAGLDGEVGRFHGSPLGDHWRYLVLDGVYLRVKQATKVRRRLVLCAYGIGVSGERRLLDFRLADSESAAAWEAFLNNLHQRGLWGGWLRLITTDGCAGLQAALQVVYPYVPRQHCWVHKLRNVAALLRRSQEEECLAGAKRIYRAETRRDAIHAYWEWAQRWRAEAPKAVACIERDLDGLLAHFACPLAQRKKVRTTNCIERCFVEVRRRTRPMTCFTNDASCERIIYAVISHLNGRWEGRPLPEFTHKA